MLNEYEQHSVNAAASLDATGVNIDSAMSVLPSKGRSKNTSWTKR